MMDRPTGFWCSRARERGRTALAFGVLGATWAVVVAAGCQGGSAGTSASCGDASPTIPDGVAPGETLVTLYPSQPQSLMMVIDSTNAYIGTSQGGPLMKVPLSGGPPTTLTSIANGTTALAVDATDVYWTDVGNVGGGSPDAGPTGLVRSVPIGGGTPTIVATGQASPLDVAVDDASVYWLNARPGAVMKVPKGGGTPIVLASLSANSLPSEIAVDATSVYWTSNGSNVNIATLQRVDKNGGTPALLADYETSISGFVIDATNAYWTTSAGDVMQTPLAGGTSTALAYSQDSAMALAVDDASLYWTTSGGSVLKLPLAGGCGAPSTLYTGQDTLQSLAVDSTSVYFTTFQTGLLKITPK
jgi:hypothetical protein